MRMRVAIAFTLLALVGAACGAAQPSTLPTELPTGQQTGVPTAGTSGQPTPVPSDGGPTSPPTTPGDSPGPGPTFPPLDEPPEPLPAPEFDNALDISIAESQPELATQVVVSMLDQLGIGIYNADGTPIRAGTEQSDADLFLFDPEVRGLITTFENADQESDWISFRDFHAALAGLGFGGSAEDLAAAYSDAYAAQPDAAITQFIGGYVDVEVPITRFTAWLLFLDGFVPPHAADQAGRIPFAAIGGFLAASPAPGAGGGWGVAGGNVGSLSATPLNADPLLIAHLMAVMASTSVTVRTNPGNVHEGHGGNGAPSNITAEVHAAASTFVSPFSGQAAVPVSVVAGAGIAVTWQTDAALGAHGSTSPTFGSTTDPAGRATIVFTPKSERANGHGDVMTEMSVIQASVSGGDVITRLYGRPDLGALVPGVVTGVGQLAIEWHEPSTMLVSLTNVYDVTFDVGLGIGNAHQAGTDKFFGKLAQQPDGTWKGTAIGSAEGSFFGQAFGKMCSSSWSTTQVLEVIGYEDPNAQTGDFRFVFTPFGPPRGSTGSGTCPPTKHKWTNGIFFAPYNDYDVSTGTGFATILPPKPGSNVNYPITSVPGSGFTLKNTSWQVDISYFTP